jgi:hypothetical protein
VNRYTSAGTVSSGWPAQGVLIQHDIGGSIDIAPAGTTGIYVAMDGYVQRVASSGTITPPSIQIPSSHMRIVEDGAGGVYIAFTPSTTPTILQLTRVASNGTFPTGWSAAGLFLASLAPSQGAYLEGTYEYHTMVPDGTGGVLVACVSYAFIEDTDYQAPCVTVHRVLASGANAPGWDAVNGARVGTYLTDAKANPMVISDGAGGAVVTWQEERDDPPCASPGCTWDIFAGRVMSSGAIDPSLPAGGRGISAVTTIQQWPFVSFVGASRAIVAWQDNRPNATSCAYCEESVYAQEVAFDATAPAQTTTLTTASNPTGVMATWTATGDDGMTGTADDIDFRYSTAPITEANFTSATPGPGFEPVAGGSQQCGDVFGLSPCTWYYFAVKTRDEAGNLSPLSNVRYARTKCSGSATYACDAVQHGPQDGVVPTFPIGLDVWPNPAISEVRLRYAAPAEERTSRYALSVYDMAGRQVKVIDEGPDLLGSGDRVWLPREDGGLGPGVYYLRFRAGKYSQTRTLVILRHR